MQDVSLVGVCDLDLAKARAWGGPAFDDLTDMLRQVEPDLLDIILPPQGHYEAIRAALDHGLKWLICQKPFGVSTDDARNIARMAREAGATLVVHENFRFQPWYRAVKAALDRGAVGTVLQASFRLRPGDGQGPQAYLDRQPYFRDLPRFLVHETAVHWVDTFRYLLGDPVAVYADLRRINPDIAGEDAGLILFDHPGGVRSVFDGNRHLDHASDNLRRTMGEAVFEGTDGTLSVLGDGSVRYRQFGSMEEDMILPPDQHRGFGGDCVHALQSHVVRGIHDADVLENRAGDYVRVLEIVDAIYDSDRAGEKRDL